MASQYDPGCLDIAHLLPPLPRKLLNTYPTATQEVEGGSRDCFWSALNFFNEVPDNGFLKLAYTMDYVRANYEPAKSVAVYGDLVFLVNEAGVVVHAAVYLAHELVFTKNGSSPFRPWVIMQSKDMLDAYAAELPLRTVIFTKRRS